MYYYPEMHKLPSKCLSWVREVIEYQAPVYIYIKDIVFTKRPRINMDAPTALVEESSNGDSTIAVFIKTFPHAPVVCILTTLAFFFAARNYQTTFEAISDINHAGTQRMMSQQIIIGSLFKIQNISVDKVSQYFLPTLGTSMLWEQRQIQDRYGLSGLRELQLCLGTSDDGHLTPLGIILSCNAYLDVANTNVRHINDSAVSGNSINFWILVTLGVMEMLTLIILICYTRRRHWVDRIVSREGMVRELATKNITQQNEMHVIVTEGHASEIKAYAAVNHNGKRVMNECVFWLEKIETEITQSDNKYTDHAIWDRIMNIVTFIKIKCVHGGRTCTRVLMQKAMADGIYTCNPIPQNMMDFLSHYEDTLTYIEVHDIPQWVLFDAGVLDIVMSNAVSNARSHGENGGIVKISAYVSDEDSCNSINLHVVNKPGICHDKWVAIQNQNENQSEGICANGYIARTNGLGGSQSTFLGMKEIKGASDILHGAAELKFEEDAVRFTFQFPLHELPLVHGSSELAPLPNDLALVFVDDDYATRAQYKGLAKKLKLDADCFQILGATYAEASSVSEAVMDMANKYTTVLCIFDQNLDQYTEGSLLGTDIVSKLTNSFFSNQLVLFIRSANDTIHDIKFYREKGADDVLSKSLNVKQLTAEILWKYQSITRQRQM